MGHGCSVGSLIRFISTQHDEGIEHGKIKQDIIDHVIKPVCKDWLDDDTIYHVNPAGSFVRGGPFADSGLTGRKIIVDTYGGIGRHGGGCFSGKDPTKVDRSGAYAARYIAKNIVAADLAEKCEVQIAYAIGVAKPVSVLVQCFERIRLRRRKLQNWCIIIFHLNRQISSRSWILEDLSIKRQQSTVILAEMTRTLPGKESTR